MATVSELISSAQGYVTTVTGQASTAMSDATQLVNRIGYTIPNFDPAGLPEPPTLPDALTAPQFDDVPLDIPSEPGSAPVYQDIAAIESGTAPTLSVAAPTFISPTAPSALAAFQTSAPTVNTNLAFPDVPAALVNPLIDAPNLIERTEPTRPQTALPSFDAITPLDTTVAPTDLEGSFAAAYRDAAPSTITMIDGYVDAMLVKHNPRYHDQMTAIETQLDRYLAGGTGLDPTIEDAIYSRAREKNDVEVARVRDAAYAEAASRGFTLPTGMLLGAVARARQEAANNNAKVSADIAIAQAELEQKNLQFAVTTSIGLRTVMLNATLSYMQNLTSINAQALDYAKSTLNAILEMYNTSVKAYEVKLEAYKAEAAVFDTRLKAALAGIELYKSEIQALEALTNVDRAKVEVYRARIDSLGAYANIYKAQIDAVLGRASLEKMKIDVFQAQVQAFGTQVQAKNAEWQGYSAQLSGQEAQARVFGSQVQAYSARVQGWQTEVQARSEVVRATATTNEARSRQFAAEIDAFRAIVAARGQVASTKLENQRQEVIAFQAESQAQIANANLRNEHYRATSTVAIENAKESMAAQVAGINSQAAFGQSVANLGTANAHVFASLAGAALSGMNTLASQNS